MNFKNSVKFLFALTLVVLALSLQYIMPIFKSNVADAASFTTVSISNGNFNQSSTSYYLDDSPTGWTKLVTSTNVTEGTINTNQDKFTSYISTYYLQEYGNPGTMYNDTTDTKIMMINARSSSSLITPKFQGYKSSSITLSPYSYYTFSVLVKTEVGAMGSIYLTGLPEEYVTEFENVISTNWTEYKFYVSTGSLTQTVNFELWLGTNNQIASPNAVFFDNVTGQQISKDRFDTEAVASSKLVVAQIPVEYVSIPAGYNFDFEAGNLTGWTAINALPANTFHQVLNTNSEFMSGNGFTNLGGDNVFGSYALWLASTQTPNTSFGYTSNEIELSRFIVYKININVKVQDGTTARVVIRESDDVQSFYENELLSDYEPNSIEHTITSNGTDSVLNNYQTYSTYIKGHPLYDTHFTIELWLGSEESPSSGSVVFDNITIEQVTGTEYANATTSTTVKKVALETLTGSTNLANGTFNSGTVLEQTTAFPVSPDNWTSEMEDETKNVYGIVNTYAPHYNLNKANYGNITNPGNPAGFLSDTNLETNNILMLWNKEVSYQNVTSDSVSVTSNSYYILNFYFKTAAFDSPTVNFNLSVLDQNDSKVFEQENINVVSWENWELYTMTIKVGSNTTSLKVKFSLGTEENSTKGYLFVDNVELVASSNITDQMFSDLAQIQSTNSKNTILDLTNAMMNIRLLPDENGIYPITAFTGSLENAESGSDPVATSGIVDGVSNIFSTNNSDANQNVIKNLMFIRNLAGAKYSLTAKSSNTLSQDTIYKFSIYLKTQVLTLTDTPEFNVSFSLEGLEDATFTQIETTDEWTEYMIIVNSTSESSVKLKFTLETEDITGAILFIDNFSLTELTTEEYSTLLLTYENEDAQDYDQMRKTTLVVGSTTLEEDVTEDDTTTDSSTFNWLIVPSLITAVALLVAIVGFSIRRINFKKWQKRQVTHYDRNKTLYRDVLRKEAEEKRDVELKQLNEELKMIESDINALEEENKEKLTERRKSRSGVIDRQVEKEFKLYATKHTNLENKKEKLLQKISDVNSAEYLLSLQRKISSEKAKNLKAQNIELQKNNNK